MQQTDSSGIDYKKLYDQQIVVIEELSRQLAAHDERVSFLSAEIAKLRKMIFGTRVERFVPAEGATRNSGLNMLLLRDRVLVRY